MLFRRAAQRLSLRATLSRSFGAAAEPTEPEYITVKFHDWHGDETVIDKAMVGETVLDVANRFWLPIPGKCSGGDGLMGNTDDWGEGPSCRFCHVIVDRTSHAKLPPALIEEEINMEIFEDRTDTSRCACQLTLTKDLDGMHIGMPSYAWGQPGVHDGGDIR